MKINVYLFGVLGCLWTAGLSYSQPAEIQVVDSATGRGVPMVELKTVHHVRYFTDSAGRLAIDEPELRGQEVFFYVRSHGYEFSKDGFGLDGTRIRINPGEKTVLKIERRNIAERLYRVTGAGIYRDTALLGMKAPIEEPFLNAQVVGQDSTQAVVYQGKIRWFWGDTSQISYPLGNFRTTGARSDLPGQGGLDPAVGINLEYFQNEKGFTKEMCPFENKEGIIWIDSVFTVPDRVGKEVMLAHYERLKGLSQSLEHGICQWNDEKNHFEKVLELDKAERVRSPHGHPVLKDDYIYFGAPVPIVRTRRTRESVLDAAQYEVWTQNLAAKEGEPLFHWSRSGKAVGPDEERKLLEEAKIKPEQAHFSPTDVESGKAVRLHRGSVRWNEWRKKWILIAGQLGGSSMLGEIWYSEAPEPWGPFAKARKILTHEKYSFYNPVHHPFFDKEGGRLIYFEGTYTADFSGNEDRTPRYDYNQIMHRLNLDDERLRAVREE